MNEASLFAKDVEIVGVDVFFRDDHPDGVCARIEFSPGEGQRFAQWCDRAARRFDAFPPSMAIEWLTEVGRRLCASRVGEGEALDQQEGRIIIATIYWLERRGHIRSDEHNGVQWIGMRGDKDLIAIRNDEPTPDKLREAREGIPNFVAMPWDDPRDFEAMLRKVLGIEGRS